MESMEENMFRVIAAVMALGIVGGLGFALVSGTDGGPTVHVASTATPGSQG